MRFLLYAICGCIFAACGKPPALHINCTENFKPTVVLVSDGGDPFGKVIFTAKNTEDDRRLSTYGHILGRLSREKVRCGCALDSMVAADKYFKPIAATSSDEEVIAFLFNEGYAATLSQAIRIVKPDFIPLASDSVKKRLTQLYNNHERHKLKTSWQTLRLYDSTYNSTNKKPNK